MIDEDAGEIAANGSVQQDGSNRAVDTSREAEDDTVLSQLSLQFGYGAVDEGCGTPLLLASADVYHKVLEQLLALSGVIDLRMELDSPD